MSPALRLLAVSTVLAFSTTGVLAEIAPSCPGGGTATGTFSCKGLINPVCTEGPPWKCAIVDDDKKTAEMGDGGSRPTRKFDFVVSPSLSGGGSVFEPGPSGGGGGFDNHVVTVIHTNPAPSLL